MNARVAILGALVTLGAAPALDMRLYNADYPPARYQGGGQVLVRFVDPTEIDHQCGAAPAPFTRAACTGHDFWGREIIVLPNPCAMPRPDLYALYACHELGHVNHWPATHDH